MFRPAAATIADAQRSPAGVRQRDTAYRRVLALADVVAAALALSLGVVLLGDSALQPAMLAALPIVVLLSKVVGLYDRDELLLRKTTLEEAPALFQMATLYTLLTWLLEGFVVAGDLRQRQVVAIWVGLFFFTLVARALARSLARHMVTVERCLLIGDATAYEHMRGKLAGGSGVKAALVGRIPLPGRRGGEENGSMPADGVLGRLEDLPLVIPGQDIHRVIIAPRVADSEGMLDVISTVKALGVKVSVLPRIFEVVGSSVEFDDLHGVPVLGVRRFGLTASSRLMKRVLDILGASLLLALAAPLLLLIAVMVALGSRGPILFRQIRIGRDGQPFWMVKFRTMVNGADDQKAELRALNQANGLFKIADDPRITRIGRLLRRTSLDELPQLWNVLRGEMSLVGPRPLVIEEDGRIEGRHRRRLHLTPGMTGHWQILGSSRIPLHEMVKIDYLYVANWSIWADVKILLRTVPYVLSRRGL